MTLDPDVVCKLLGACKEEDAVVTLNPDLVCKLLGNCQDELDFAFDHKIPIG